MHANTYTQNNYSYINYTNKGIYTNYIATQTHAHKNTNTRTKQTLQTHMHTV